MHVTDVFYSRTFSSSLSLSLSLRTVYSHSFRFHLLACIVQTYYIYPQIINRIVSSCSVVSLTPYPDSIIPVFRNVHSRIKDPVTSRMCVTFMMTYYWLRDLIDVAADWERDKLIPKDVAAEEESQSTGANVDHRRICEHSRQTLSLMFKLQ